MGIRENKLNPAITSSDHFLVRIIFYALSVIVLIIPAIRLGYPILHGDSGVYITSGVNHFAPVERPVTYGLFVVFSSLGISLWFVVLVQSFITTFVLDRFLIGLLGAKYHPVLLLMTILILTLTTSIGYFVCQLKPDFFLPLIFLGYYSI